MNRWRWRRTRIFVLCLLAGGAASVGCDRRPKRPPPAPEATPPPATVSETSRPTTQELLLGPYKTVQLPGMPLTARVPEIWKVESGTPWPVLKGPTPADSVMIQLAQRDSIAADRLPAYIDRLKQQDGGDVLVKPAELRDRGRIKVLERLTVSKPITTPLNLRNALGDPLLDSKGNPVTLTTTPMTWRLMVFIPSANGSDRYELNLVGFIKEQYDADKSLIEGILNSVVYEQDVPATLPGQ